MKIFAALKAYESSCRVPEPKVLLLTVTAPGVDGGLPWDEKACAERGPHKHSGPDGCRVVEGAAEAFNKRASGWWRRLHSEASQATRRVLGFRPTLLVRAFEMQRRGVLHVHPVLGYSTPRERVAAEVYRRELERLAPKHGWGFVNQKFEPGRATEAAAYVSSYFVKGKKGKMTLRESVTAKKMPKSIVHVSTVLTKASGVTMRSLRLKRYQWVLRREKSVIAEHEGTLEECVAWAKKVLGIDCSEMLAQGP